jgi:hypothetical protein
MFNSSLCASVLNGRASESLFESHVPYCLCVESRVPLRLCDRRTILAILISSVRKIFIEYTKIMGMFKFDLLNFDSENLQNEVILVIVDSFKKRKGNKQQHTINLLSELFDRLDFDFKNFLSSLNFLDEELNVFLSYILYGIYYHEIFIPSLCKEKKEQIHFFLLTLLAECCDKKIQSFLTTLPQKEQIQLSAYSISHMREGAWIILNKLEALHDKDIYWNQLLKNLKNKYYDPQHLGTLICDFPDKIVDLPQLIGALEKHGIKEVTDIRSLLPKLIDAIVHSPTVGFESLEKLKSNLIPYSPSPIPDEIRQAEDQLKNLFDKHRNQKYTISEMNEFFKLFGLRGYFLDTPATGNSPLSLLETLKISLETFQTPFLAGNEDRHLIMQFILSLSRQLYAYHREPIQYFHGLNRLVYALPTRGKQFQEMPWLPSILAGLTALITHLNQQKVTDNALVNYPIVLFDQAPSSTFAENKSYIQQLAIRYKASIWHLSMGQIRKLAKKLGIAHWIRQHKGRTIGYAGGRNCCLFLAPVIFAAAKEGKNDFNALMEMPTEKLLSLFDASVLGKGENDISIHLGEDDVYIPPCNIFVDTLFVHSFHHLYFARPVYMTGRATHKLSTTVDGASLLQDPSSLYSSQKWGVKPTSGVMKGMVTKPRFCLPLPFGGEEVHSIPTHYFANHFHQPVIHFAGTRFPSHLFPTSPLDGILKYLKTYIPYSFQICMSSRLLDTTNKLGRLMFPWNDPLVRKERNFQSFGELQHYVMQGETQKEVLSRLNNNLKWLSSAEAKEDILVVCLRRFSNFNHSLPIPPQLIRYFTKIQKEAKLFTAFCLAFLTNSKKGLAQPVDITRREIEKKFKIKIEKTSFTKQLFLLINCLESFNFLTRKIHGTRTCTKN